MMPDNPKTTMRSKLAVKPKTSFDGYCPCCRENIGWDVLAPLFEGQVFDPDRTYTKRHICSHCDSVVLVNLLVDFQLTEVE